MSNMKYINYPEKLEGGRPCPIKQASILSGADTTEYDEMAEHTFPAEFYMISACDDSQTSADVSNLQSSFIVPCSQGKAGGACTGALLSSLYEAHDTGTIKDISWVSLLKSMRKSLLKKGFNQVPQLTSSRFIDVNQPFNLICNSSGRGTKRAVLIGINYVGQEGDELSGCHNDVENMKTYLKSKHGFQERHMSILMDDGKHKNPTFENIMDAYSLIVRRSKPGDSVFLHFSGHGSRVEDQNNDEDDGYDETLLPVDYLEAGQIVDDDLCNLLVKGMSKGVLATALFDCCHSGTALDLPYTFVGNGATMVRDEVFNFGQLSSVVASSRHLGYKILKCIFKPPLAIITYFKLRRKKPKWNNGNADFKPMKTFRR